MASVDGTIPLPSGFKYEFLTPVDEDFICQICHLPLKQAVLTRCGHRFCNECLTEFLRRKQNPECPCDREKIDEEKDIFPDRASQRRVLSYMVKCPSDGCLWTGQLCDVERHEGNCVYKIIECTNQHCNVRVPRGSLDEHLRASCLWRIVHCPHCSQSHPKSKEDLHNEVCLMLPLNCACHQIFPRGEMQNHKETECILTLLPCPYLELGCTAKVERQNLEKHLLDQTSSHLSLACKKLVNFRKEFDDEKAKFEKQIDDLKKDYDSLVLKLSAQEKGTSNPKMETPTFVWKLSAFSEMLREAKRGRNVKIHSTPFYTAPFGYKLKLSLKPNGDGSGKNTHLSVFVIIMKGEYDGMLLWPFNQKVSLTLIDQQESSDERENIVMHFRATNNPENFMRPVSEENTGRGFGRFVSHEKLIKTRKFIVDDTLFIQVYVGPL